MQEFVTKNPEETKALATRLVKMLAERPGIRATSTIVGLQGNLGAGKTVFVKGAAQALGVTDEVTSPTFVIEKIYTLPEGSAWKRLVHIDAYRMESAEELKTIGWHDIATDPGNLIMMEWPEQVGLGIPERAVWVDFETVDEHSRAIKTNIDIPDTTTDHV